MLNIFEEVAKECGRHGVRNALILGTAPTMSSAVFPALLAKYGVHGTVPGTDQDQALVIKLIEQLQAGECHGAADQLQRIAERSLSFDSGKRQAVCLSCTELPLAFAGLGERADV